MWESSSRPAESGLAPTWAHAGPAIVTVTGTSLAVTQWRSGAGGREGAVVDWPVYRLWIRAPCMSDWTRGDQQHLIVCATLGEPLNWCLSPALRSLIL